MQQCFVIVLKVSNHSDSEYWVKKIVGEPGSGRYKHSRRTIVPPGITSLSHHQHWGALKNRRRLPMRENGTSGEGRQLHVG
jgi:hypothetical protein